MKRLILFFFVLVELSFQTKGQLDYNAWPIFSTKTDISQVDSVAVLHFLGYSNLSKYHFRPKDGFNLLPATISDPLSGRLLMFTNIGNSIFDSSGQTFEGIIENQLGQYNEGILFRDYIFDTIYSISNPGKRTVFRKLTYQDSIRVWQESVFATKYIQQVAMTRDSALKPILAFALKDDTLNSDEIYWFSNAIDLYKLESGILNFYSRLWIPNINIGNSMKFSPNGEYFCLGTSVYRFNSKEAKLTSSIDLTPFFQSKGINNKWNVFSTFSMNSRFLYLRCEKNYTYHDSTFIFQFDLENWDATKVKESVYLVYADSLFENMRQIQLAPDGKIYCAYSAPRSNKGYLSAILDPNQPGAACNFEKDYFSLNSQIKTRPDSFSTVTFPNICIFSPQSSYYLDLGPDTLLCEGDSFELRLKTNEEVLWITGDTSPSIWVKTSGYYSARINFPLGSFVDTIHVQFAPKPVVYIGPDTAFCDLVDYLIQPNADSGSFLWNTGAQSKNLYVNQEGQYSLKVESGNACLNADTVYIDRLISPAFKDLDTTLCEGDQIVLGPGTSGLKYLWSNRDTSSRIITNKSGVYILKVRNQICEEEVTYAVHIIPEDSCTSSIYFPNTFTPNGDIYNPYFFPVGNNFEVQSLNIYNRWGQHIYTHDAQKPGWDGWYLGVPVPEGVYFYTCTYTVLQQGRMNRVNTKGIIHVLR